MSQRRKQEKINYTPLMVGLGVTTLGIAARLGGHFELKKAVYTFNRSVKQDPNYGARIEIIIMPASAGIYCSF